MKKLIEIWKKYLPAFIVSTCGVALRNFEITFLNAYLAERILFLLSKEGDEISNQWAWLFVLIVFLAIIDAFFLFLHNITIHDMIIELKQTVYIKIMNADLYYLGKMGEKGKVISNFTSDMRMISDILEFQILVPLLAFFSGIGAIVILITTTKSILIPTLTLLSSLIFLMIQKYLSKLIHRYQSEFQKQIATATSLNVYCIERKKNIIESGDAEFAVKQLEMSNARCRYTERKVSRLKSLNEIISKISSILQYSIGPIIGVWLFANGKVSLDKIVLIGPAMALLYTLGITSGNIIIALQTARAGIDKTIQYLQIESEKQGGKEKKFNEDAMPLEINNLSFEYADGTKVMRNFHGLISNGKVIGIKGDSGSGKTTLLKILMGLFPYEGSVKMFGTEIKEYSTMFLKKNIHYVPQSNIILPGGVHENFYTENEYLNLDKAKEILYDVGIQNNNDTKEWETNSLEYLSGGEKQRLALARLFLSDAPILMIDETFSGIDREGRYTLMKKIKSDPHRKLTLIISHDEEMLNMCDQILTM